MCMFDLANRGTGFRVKQTDVAVDTASQHFAVGRKGQRVIAASTISQIHQQPLASTVVGIP